VQQTQHRALGRFEEGDRILYGAQLYRQKLPIIVAGGRIDWRGSGPSESTDMAAFSGGVPTKQFRRTNSLNTYENAVNVGKSWMPVAFVGYYW